MKQLRKKQDINGDSNIISEKESIKISNKQKKVLKEFQDYLESNTTNPLVCYNVEVIRDMHNDHFFQHDCLECILLLAQYYNKFMTPIGIEKYYDGRKIMDQVVNKINGKLKSKFKE